MTEPLRVLLIEDSLVDAEMNERELGKAGFPFVTRRVDREETLVKALTDFRPDLILSDYHLPCFDGIRALAICQERAPAIPLIFVTGTMGEELAVESIRHGATDYIIKDRLARLPMAVLRALTERRIKEERIRDQAALRASEERYHQLFEAMGSGVAIFRPEETGESFTLQAVNRAAERIEGLTRQEMLGREVRALLPGEAGSNLLAALQGVARSGVPERLPPTLYRDGQIGGWRESYVYRLSGGEVVAVYDDVSERMEYLARIERLNRTLRTISACNRDLVRTHREEDLLQGVSQDLLELGQHLMVWIAYPDPDAPGGLKTQVTCGDPAVVSAFRGLVGPHAQDCCGLPRAALAEGRPQAWSLAQPRPEVVPSGLQIAGVAAAVALPLRHDQELLGAITVLSGSGAAFDQEEVNLLEELAADLAFGIVVQRTAQERDAYLSQVGRAMQGTVAVLASATEMRDPYTAGHEQRVATLAVAIARDLGLPTTLIEGLYLGGMIHDIGKLAVPAEILNKPGRLNPIEFRLIQQHVDIGYRIVKEIEFPWPLAAMILQHHERLDGSGYPQGLHGEDLLLESRILAVADVVEAMSSHRPYRAGLTLEVALDEITQGKGSRFDPLVVDACVRVILANGMRLPEVPPTLGA